MHTRRPVDLIALATAAVLLAACERATGCGDVILSTTTSTQDSGLLDALIPVFEEESGCRVKTIAVGSGQALALAGRGEADVVLSHAPNLERQYVADGSVTRRRLVMHNDFLVVGPEADSAGIRGLRRAAEAFSRIASARATFVSRGDSSGTHLRELSVWSEAGIEPRWEGYIEVGQGMGATLMITSERNGYTLTDRGTYLAFKPRVPLVPLVEGDPLLLNIYHVLEVNADRFDRVNGAGGTAFADFILSQKAQAIIDTFGVQRFGEPLFFPDAGKSVDDL